PNKLQQITKRAIKKDFGGNTHAYKKAVVTRALESTGVLSKIGEVDFPAALMLVNEHPYKVNQFFLESKLDVAAKPGDIAPFDIVVPAGETDLPPGPALSQLKVAGLNVKIDKGKIVVAKDSVVAKEGDEITAEKAQALQMLGIKPFKVGVNVAYAYDGETLYNGEVLNITQEDVIADIEEALAQSLNASINASYPTEQNIKLLVTKAIREAKNASLNSSYYSSYGVKDLIILAVRQANALPKQEGG
ncbi:MAG: hypothetical protein D6797_00560, partial [Bdellovibrio sp.]